MLNQFKKHSIFIKKGHKNNRENEFGKSGGLAIQLGKPE